MSAGLRFRSRAGKELEQLIITSAIVHCVSIWVFALRVLFTSGEKKKDLFFHLPVESYLYS